MKLVVFGGSGVIGRAVASDLVGDQEIAEVALVGRRREALEEVGAWLESDKVTLHSLDIYDREATLRLMAGYDVGVLALPDRRASYRLAEHAIEAGLNVVDMLEEFHRRPDAYETEGLEKPAGMSLEEYGESLHRRAQAAGVTFLDGMGLAPGLTNVTLGQGIRQLDRAETAIARVGGIPSKEASRRHPLRYVVTWSFEHVLREYVVHLDVIRDGERVEVEAGSDRESFRFRRFGRDEVLECAVTPGMPSFLLTHPELRNFAEKTVRWPGHWQGVETLKECGLLGLEPVELDGARVVPRDLLAALLTPRLVPEPGETDVAVMYNTLIGVQDGRRVRKEYFLWDEAGEAETARGITAMMRTTGYTVALGARLLGQGKIRQHGIVAPEEAIPGELYPEFIAELARRQIVIEEQTTPEPAAEEPEPAAVVRE